MLSFLRLYQFRNFQEETFRFSPQLNVFLGENAQGKTNLIEAIYLLASGESFRAGETKHLVREHKNQASLIGKIEQSRFTSKIQLDFSGGKKNFYVDDKRKRFENELRVVQFNPESLSAIKGSSEQRRQMLDEVLAQEGVGKRSTLLNFKKILRARNIILRDLAHKSSTSTQTEETLRALSEQFLLLATQVTHLRLNLIKNLRDEFNIAAQNILKTSSSAEIRYVVSSQLLHDPSEQEIFHILRKRMIELDLAERSTGVTLVGPHKHDLIFCSLKETPDFIALKVSKEV